MTDNKKTALEKFWELEQSAPKHIDIYVEKSMDILDRIHDLMEEEEINQKQLAQRLGKTEAEVSKWINGVQNFTLKTICKLEEALGKDIISIPKKRSYNTTFSGSQGSLTKINKEEKHNLVLFQESNNQLVAA